MRISIVIPAFNEEKFIARSLRKIKAATDAFSELGWGNEIIVCDNNSTDRTADKARAAGARVVFEPVNQISRARNRGAAKASGDWLLFVDADCVVHEDTLTLLAASLLEGPRQPQLPDSVAKVPAKLAENGRRRVGDERGAALGVEAVECLDEAQARDLNQVLELLGGAPIAKRE